VPVAAKPRLRGLTPKPKQRVPGLGAVLTATPTLGALLCILSWDLSFIPALPGVDGSWQAGLQIATHEGLQWGPEIVHTYGPIGFLNAPILYFQDQTLLAMFYGAALHLALCITLVWSLRRSLPLGLALVAAFLLALFPFLDTPAILVVCWSIFVLDSVSRRAASVYAVVIGALAGFELLFKLNVGMEVFAMGVVCLATLDGRRRNLPLFAAALSISLLGLWLAAGQDLANLGLYLDRSVNVVSGYSQALAYAPADRWKFIAAAAISGLFLLAITAAGSRSKPRRLQLGALTIAGIFWFAMFKQGFVRQDHGHMTIYFGSVLVGAAILAGRLMIMPSAAQGTRAGRYGRLAVPALAVMAIFAFKVLPAEREPDLSPISHLRTFADTTRYVFEPSRRRTLQASSHQTMLDTYRLDPVTRKLIGDHTVHIDPWEAEMVPTFDLNWKPPPVFEIFMAYTKSLDEINAEAFAAADGPQRILRLDPDRIQPGAFPTGALDNRYPGQDSPAARRSQLCNYVDIRTTGLWQVLARAPDRCSRPRLIRSVDARYGTPVEVPVPSRRDVVVFARIHGAGPSLPERIRQFLFRASPQEIELDGPGGGAFRFIPATAADGLLMWTPRWADFRAPFALGPMAHHFTLTRRSGSFEVDFYAVRMRRPGHASHA
jgi:hypothetical protein